MLTIYIFEYNKCFMPSEVNYHVMTYLGPSPPCGVWIETLVSI